MIFKKPGIFYLILFALLAVNLVFFLRMILKLPDFMMDDFMLFAIIDKNPSGFILTNPGEIVHLAVRPLAFFSFWFDHIPLNLSSFQMKCETLIIHLCFLSAFFFFAYDLLSYLKIKVNLYKLGFVALTLSLHTICVWWIIWLQQRNELMMLLFYVLSLYMVLLFIRSGRNYYLLLSGLFYVLSFLSKQQSLHLPLIVIAALVFFKDNFSTEQRRKLAYFAVIGVVLMIAYLAINSIYYQSTSLLQFSGLWKKPLSAFSAIGLALLPFETDKVYNYLLTEKTAAVIIFVIFFGLALYLFIKKRNSGKILLFLPVVFALSFFPVISAEVTLRIITIQVFIVYCALLIFIHRTKLKTYLIYPALAVILMLNVRASLVQFDGERSINDKRKESVVKLDEFFRTGSVKSGNSLILASPFGSFIPYQYYFYKFNKFGKDPMSSAPFGYTFYFKNFYAPEARLGDEIDMNAKITDSVCSVFTTKEYIAFFKGDKLNGFNVTHDERTGLRGYNRIDFTVPEEYINSDKIYYDGVQWIKVNR